MGREVMVIEDGPDHETDNDVDSWLAAVQKDEVRLFTDSFKTGWKSFIVKGTQIPSKALCKIAEEKHSFECDSDGDETPVYETACLDANEQPVLGKFYAEIQMHPIWTAIKTH